MEQEKNEFDAVISSNENSTYILVKSSKIYKTLDNRDTYIDLILEEDYEEESFCYILNIFKQVDQRPLLEEFYRSDRIVYNFADEAIKKYNEIVKELEKIN